jgi:diguanylate cyclase (GGDEF)-like protein/PAS domain S-box-containing protein
LGKGNTGFAAAAREATTQVVRRMRWRAGSDPRGRASRFVVRFAAASLVLFVAIGIGLSQYISHAFVDSEEHAARVHAQFVSDSILRYEISPQEIAFLSPMTGEDRNQMYRFVASRVLRWPIVRVKIWRSDGLIIFSDATQLIGRRLPVDAELREAFAGGRAVNGITDLTSAENVTERPLASKLLETYVPVYADPDQTRGTPAAVIEVYQDYGSIQAQVNDLNRAVFAVLAIALALLWLLLLPVIHRISRRVTRQNRELREADAKHRAVVDHIPAITYTDLVDEEMSTTYISPQVEELLGITPEEWCTDPDLWYRHLHEDDREKTRDAYLRARDAGEPFSEEYRMVARDGRIVWFRDEFIVLPGEDGAPAVVQGVMLDITLRKYAEEQLAFLAYHDKLTGLPNRVMFEELLDLSLARAKRRQLGVAVLCLDLDDFKLVNDSLGHAAGDELLKQVAERLQEATRDTDLVARQGGDEFLVLLADMELHGDSPIPDVADAQRMVAEAVAVRVHEALREPFVLNGTEFYVSASIGISMYPHDATDADGLLRNADAALYESKRNGPGGFLVHSVEGAGSVSKLSLATRLRKAVERQHWVLHYQPVVDLATGSFTGVEGLLRWQDPRGGLIAPGEFIPLAEEMGLIEAIGDWVIAELARQAAEWEAQGIRMEAGFNLSPRQLWQPDLVFRVLTHLERAGVDPSTIVVEITETAAMTDPDRTQRVLWELHGRGVRLAIDDFGTGYSSLSRLKHLPVDILKIDRSFVRDVPDEHEAASMVRAMVQLADSVGMVPLAEGIETEKQWQFLLEQGCTLGQGFYFGRPVSAEEITPRAKSGSALPVAPPALGPRSAPPLDAAG